MDRKPDLNKITSRESQSLDKEEVKDSYNIIYGVREDEEEIIRSPYEIDREKTIFRSRQIVSMEGTINQNDGHKYSFNEYSKSMDLAKEIFLHDTIPAIRVKDKYANNTRICHCKYPGHTKIDMAHLYHGEEIAQTIDNVFLDLYVQKYIPDHRRPFYERMVGGTKENTTWNTELPSFSVSVPQPWYFSIVKGAELRLNTTTQTTLTYIYRRDPTSSLLMQVLDKDNIWVNVDINGLDREDEDGEHYIDRLTIQPLSKLSPILDLRVTLYKCLHEYSQQLTDSHIEIPSEDVIFLDQPEVDTNVYSIDITSNDFVKSISILVEPWELQNKCQYTGAIVKGDLTYSSSLKKLGTLDILTMIYDDFWSSSQGLPDMENIYTISFADENKFGEYDSSISLGGLGSKLHIQVKKDKKYLLRVRLHAYKIIRYVNREIHVISSINASDYGRSLTSTN